MKTKRLQTVALVLLIGALGFTMFHRQAVVDWLRLRGYEAPAVVSQLATDTTMTDQARHLLYVNRPDITNGSEFTKKCPVGTEKTIVLGCYIGNDKGIYVYDVEDARLHGVEQVTTAHEMLHAAYRRLSTGEQTKVDNMLTDYYKHDLTDQRIKDIIESYKKSEPNDVVNEMHSIFGTEVADLPAELETYYKQYFADRSKVAGYATRYQSEFTTRRAQVAAYDTQLKEMKSQIEANQASLMQQKAALDAQARKMESYKANGQTAAYNSEVPSYNRSVDTYNALRDTTKSLIDQYNTIVDARNALALEEQELTRELSPSALPS